MYTINNETINAMLDADSRCFRAVLDFGDFAIGGDLAGGISIDAGSVQDELPCIGSVVSAQAEIVVTSTKGQQLEGKEFQLYLYCVRPEGTQSARLSDLANYAHEELKMLTHAQISELGQTPFLPIPYGKFTVLKCRKEPDIYRLTCSDRLHFADVPYKSKLTFPTTSNKVVQEISQLLGAEIDLTESAASRLKEKNGGYLLSSDGYRFVTTTWQFDIAEKPSGRTMRQMLSYIAAMRGKFVVADRVGTVVQRWYLADGSRQLDLNVDGNADGTNCRIHQFTAGESTIDVSRLVCTKGNTTLTAGDTSARAMEFECPYMTKDRLNKLAAEIGIRQYRPCEMTQQLGDPRLDVWDGFTLDGDVLFMLNMNVTCDGGLMIEVSSGGDTDTETLGVW